MGKFYIAYEGPDGSGTSTQAEMMAELLRGEALARGSGEVHLVREPNNNLPLSSMLRESIKGKGMLGPIANMSPERRALLFATARMEHLEMCVDPLLRRGAAVVSERCVLSSLAYQSLDCEARWTMFINAGVFMPARLPDLVVYLKVPPNVAAARMEASPAGRPHDFYDSQPVFQARVAVQYERAILWYTQHIGKMQAAGLLESNVGKVLVVDGTASKESVFGVVERHVREMLAPRAAPELRLVK